MRIILILMLVMFPFTVFSLGGDIDDIYGDYLISGTKRNVSMDLENVSLVDVLKALSQQSGLNFVSTEAVKERKLTLYFKDVPLKNAMDIIFKANGLGYDYFPDAKIFVVKEMGKPKMELKTKIYNLKYARLKYSRFQQEIDDLMSSETTNSDDSTTSDDISGILEAVKGVLTENGRVTKSDYTNSLIVVDVPSQFPVIDNVINALDKPQPKVMIEVEMLDVSKNLVDKLGIDYANGLTGQFTGGTYMTTFPFPDKLFKKHGVDLSSGLTASSVSLSSLTSVLQFLSTDTTTKFLARPKILTLSNETAQVNITTDEAIGVTQVITDTTTTYDVERTDTGTKLRVTPQVDPLLHEITMLVEIYNKEAKDSGISLAGMTSGNLKNPEERGARSVVRLKDGQTLLIGGLIRQDDTETKDKVPFIGDIPFLGSLFRYSNKQNKERELLVFLTPRIVTDDDANTHHLSGMQVPHEQGLSARDEAINIALDSFSER